MTKHFPVTYRLQRPQTIAQPVHHELPVIFDAQDVKDSAADFFAQHKAILAYYASARDHCRAAGIFVDLKAVERIDGLVTDLFRVPMDEKVQELADAEPPSSMPVLARPGPHGRAA